MKVSGFTIARNLTKYNYPFIASVRSVLPICDEFIINVGDSEDDTLRLVQSIRDPKVRIIQEKWDLSLGKEVLSQQTNRAMSQCRGDWGFYLQADEVIHQADLPRLKRCMQKYLNDEQVDALRFRWFHFYGSYYRYRIDHGWFQKQDRIVRLNAGIESYGDAYAFKRKDDTPLRRKATGCFLYHYGWVQPGDIMTQRRVNAEEIGFTSLQENERHYAYEYGNLDRFPVYFGTHPSSMREHIIEHALSQKDWAHIKRKYWWHPFLIGRVRFKTPKRIKEKIK